MSIYTIGHSNHDWGSFLRLLTQHDITAVADVRSLPKSRYHPQFDRPALQRALAANSIAYVFLGEELGARSGDPRCYDGRRISYRRLAMSTPFERGVQRLETGSASQRIAILCAEAEPLDCHRTVLISPVLADRKHAVSHIHRDGSLESHDSSMTRLRAQWDLLDADLFHNDEQLEAEALERQESRIAFVADDIWAEKIGIA